MNDSAPPGEPSPGPLKVAVIGASGIGKNHARWFHHHGCEVCAFVGSSPESLPKTQQVLEKGFGFTGRGYSKVEDMLERERPNAVCVSCPPPLHYDYTLQSLRSGAHVLCEKPLVYDAAKTTGELRREADEMVQEAQARGLLLGTQTQYAVTIDTLLQLTGHTGDARSAREFSMEMETKNIRAGREYEAIWIDLSPHPLSVLQKIGGDVTIDRDSIQCELHPHETSARFRLRPASGGGPIRAEVIVRFNPDRAVPLRRFVIDGHAVDYVGRNNAAGEFRSYLTAEDGTSIELPDFVDTLIGNFVDACQGRAPLLVTGADGAQNVAWQLQILERARRV